MARCPSSGKAVAECLVDVFHPPPVIQRQDLHAIDATGAQRSHHNLATAAVPDQVRRQLTRHYRNAAALSLTETHVARECGDQAPRFADLAHVCNRNGYSSIGGK